MREDLTTIDKATKQIKALARKKDAQSKNQLVRWVVTKEQHAERIIRTISDYFMAQKIKPKAKGYKAMLVKHHKVMIAAMKCKQTTDGKAVASLRKALDGIAKYWPAGK
jgi:nickel superoxide dismutase